MPTPQDTLALARQHQLAGDLARAEGFYRQAIAIEPGRAETHLDLGNCLYFLRRHDEAATGYREAIRLRPDYPEAHTNLGSVLQEQGKLDEAEACHRRALAIRTDFLDAHFNLGNACKEQGKHIEAEASYVEALRIKPDFAQARLNLGMTRLLLGKLDEGWPDYEWRWRCTQEMRPFPRPLWDGSPLGGKTILIHAEQGMGDVLMFARFAALAKERGGKVVLECPAAMLRILSACPGVDRLVALGSTPPAFDVHAPLLSLPAIFKTTLDTIPADVPYLFAEADLQSRWRRELGGGDELRVGIAWQGDPTYRWDSQRSIPLAEFEALARVEGVALYSLQKGPGTEQVAEQAGRFPLVDLGSRVDRTGAFVDTAAIMKNLDLVIAADTAVAHLAGALGVPTWLALSTIPHWPWMLGREDSPWYPTVRLFRQRREGAWGDVFGRIAEELRRAVGSRSRSRTVAVEIAPGELIDKITILAIKAERIGDPGKLANVRRELRLLEATRDQALPTSAELEALTAELKAVNEAIWDVEDELRACEHGKDFGPRFVELARSVYRNNDRRAAIKRAINEALASSLIEEKSYTPYDAG